ncbi:Hypothetical protein, putative, partial [Bodo saltans]
MQYLDSAEENLIYDEPRPRPVPHVKQERNRPDTTKYTIKLEPIENAGGVHIHLLTCGTSPNRATAYMKQALTLLSGEFLRTCCISMNLNTSPISKVPPAELINNKIAVPTQRGRIIIAMHTFSIGKKEGGDRVIGHTAYLNELFQPPQLHLINLSTLIALLANLGTKYPFIEMDFRNFFPQIPIAKALQPYMGIITRDPSTKQTSYLLQQVLTQGWNCSTFIAQSITWTAIQMKSNNEDDLGLNTDIDAASPPPYISLNHTEGTGVIVVIYDNVLVACSTQKLAALWNERIARNLTTLNIRLKYCTQSFNTCTFCGIDIAMQDNKVTWRTTEKTFAEWSTRNIYNNTSREAARIIGTIMRQDYVRSAPSLTRRPSVLLLQSICKRMSL